MPFKWKYWNIFSPQQGNSDKSDSVYAIFKLTKFEIKYGSDIILAGQQAFISHLLQQAYDGYCWKRGKPSMLISEHINVLTRTLFRHKCLITSQQTQDGSYLLYKNNVSCIFRNPLILNEDNIQNFKVGPCFGSQNT